MAAQTNSVQFTTDYSDFHRLITDFLE